MKKISKKLILVVVLLAAKVSFSQWTFPNAQGNINNTNAGSIIFTGTIDQRNLIPNGTPLDPNGGVMAQVNANLGGLIIQSVTTNPMNNFWGQNFDYHGPTDCRYRAAGPVVLQQMLDGCMYFYTAPAGVAQTQIQNFVTMPKISMSNNGGFAIGTNYANPNASGQGVLVVQNNIGLGTQTPTTQLHTTGTVRFQGLTAGGTPTSFVSIDANGQLWRSPLVTGIQNLCTNLNYVTKSAVNGDLNCSQIFDNGTSVGINQNTNFNYTGLTTVGSTIPSSTGTARLAVNGVIMSVAYFATSDERMKKNINNLPNALNKILQLEGKSHEWKVEEYPNSGMDKNRQIGFLAQDLAKVLPEAVVKKNDGTYAVNYNSIIPVLTEGIKEQQSGIDDLKSEIISLKNELYSLKKQLNQSANNNAKSYFSIAPNPFNQETKITYDLGDIKSNILCLVYDLQGKVIKQINLPLNKAKGSIIFTKENIPAGVYFVSFSTNHKELQTEKIILTN